MLGGTEMINGLVKAGAYAGTIGPMPNEQCHDCADVKWRGKTL